MSVAHGLKRAAASVGLEIALYAYELSHDVAIASVATVIIGQSWTSAEIDADLDRVIERYGINVILPFVDGAVAVASKCASRHPELFVPSCSPEMAAAMMDKVESDRLFRSIGVPLPDVIDSKAAVILKPRFGAASKGLVYGQSVDEVKGKYNLSDYLMQRYIAHRDEVTVDCYISHERGILAVSPRRRIEVIGGEVVKTVTIDDDEISWLTVRVLETLNLVGAVTVQWLRDLDTVDSQPMLMEVNPRLGGGVVASVAAGADILDLIVREACGLPVSLVKAEPGVLVARYLQEVVIR